jgi:ArsR family transcriptional regulator, arsenate/arsenite/antimonite-responsive transcriptional repressor
MEIKEATVALAALGQTTRLSIYRRLVEAGHDGSSPGELAEALSLPGATLSFHLKELVSAGLIHGEPRGRSICYRADFDAMNALVAFLTDHCCGGNPAACAPAAAAGASVCAPTIIPLELPDHAI